MLQLAAKDIGLKPRCCVRNDVLQTRGHAHLPIDIASLCAVGQEHLAAGCHVKAGCDLKDPDSIGVAPGIESEIT